MVLEPWTGVGYRDALLGFANPATVTVLAMVILSHGVQRTGVLEEVGRRLSRYASESEWRQSVATLGLAMQNTGGADLIASTLVSAGGVLPDALILALFYVSTSLLANIIGSNAGVILMIPVAVGAAARLGLNAFSFVLAVTFAASTAFMTPIGYQTNLLVYGPGGYRFTDYFRVGAPLQLLLAVVTTLGIVFYWGL